MVMDFVTLVLAVAGVAVCVRQRSSGDRISRHGLWFFSLLALSEIVSLLLATLLRHRLTPDAGLRVLGWLLAGRWLPVGILRWGALIGLIIGFGRHASHKRPTDQ